MDELIMLELTSYEMIDAGRTFTDGSSVAFTRGLALGSAYLVVAYRAGSELTKLQVTIINIGFLVFCGQALLIASVDARAGAALLEAASASQSQLLPAPAGIQYMMLVMDSVGIAAMGGCLLFMWSVRHPKTE